MSEAQSSFRSENHLRQSTAVLTRGVDLESMAGLEPHPNCAVDRLSSRGYERTHVAGSHAHFPHRSFEHEGAVLDHHVPTSSRA